MMILAIALGSIFGILVAHGLICFTEFLISMSCKRKDMREKAELIKKYGPYAITDLTI